MERDMTVGNPAKVIFNFTVPIFLGNVFQQFYSMADTIIVGKFGGSRIDGNDYVSDHYKSDWTDCRFYGDDCAKIWCGRYERDAKDCCDGSSAVGSDFGCDYDYKYAGNA